MLLIAMLITPTVAEFQPNTWIVYEGEDSDLLCTFNLPGQQDNEGVTYQLYLNSGMGYGNVYLKKDGQMDVNIMRDGLKKFTKKTIDNAKVGIDLQMKILSWASLPATISELAAEKASDIIVDKIVEEYIKSADEYLDNIDDTQTSELTDSKDATIVKSGEENDASKDAPPATTTTNYYSGVATRSRDRLAWPFKLTLIGPDTDGSIKGQIEWTNLNAIHLIEGSKTASGITFAETAYIKKGNAVLNCRYYLKPDGSSFKGTWDSCGEGDYGDITMKPL